MFVLLKVQSLQLSFRPAGVSLGGGGGARPPSPPLATPLCLTDHDKNSMCYYMFYSVVHRGDVLPVELNINF